MISRRPLVGLLVLFGLLGGLYSALVPLGEGPDEPGHMAYVWFLAREGRLPVQRAAPQPSDVPGEGHQPPLAYALAAPLLLWLPPEQRALDQPGNPRFTWAGGAELNAVAHGSRELPPWRGAVLGWHLARLVSLALGAVTVLATYQTARALAARRAPDGPRTLTTEHRSALLAAALVALNPQFLFTSALVTNDALLAALSALLLWAAAADAGGGTKHAEPSGAGVRRSGAWLPALGSRPALLGGLLGLALLTKQSALLLAPVALLAVFPAEVPGWRARARVWLGRALLLLGAAALLSGWWFARNWRLYGDPLGLAAFQAEFRTQAFDPRSPAAWAGALAQLHDSFWARFGWMNVAPPAWVPRCYLALELLALAGWLRRASRRPSGGGPRAAGWALLLLPPLALGWVFSFALTAGLVAWQGRLLFPALPALALLLAGGLAAWLPDAQPGARPRRAAALLGGLGFALLALWLPLGVIGPAYPRHTLAETVALARLGQPAYARFGKPGDPGAELRGWSAERQARPGAQLHITLVWHARGRQNRDWAVFLHLLDGQREIQAESNRQPLDGAFPMTQWVAGDWLEDRHTLELPPGLAPGRYTLRVGLWDQQGTGERAARFGETGKLAGDALDLGVITVSP